MQRGPRKSKRRQPRCRRPLFPRKSRLESDLCGCCAAGRRSPAASCGKGRVNDLEGCSPARCWRRRRSSAPLEDADRRAVAQEMRETSFDASQVVFAPRRSGARHLSRRLGPCPPLRADGRGPRAVLRARRAGQIFGEIAVLDGGVRTADATAVTKVSALTLSKASVDAPDRDAPRGARSRDQVPLQSHPRGRPSARGHRALPDRGPACALLPRGRAPEGRGRSPAPRSSLDLPISQSELALLIGASRPKVNAALALLEDGGAIERTDRGFTCDIEELETIAGPESPFARPLVGIGSQVGGRALVICLVYLARCSRNRLVSLQMIDQLSELGKQLAASVRAGLGALMEPAPVPRSPLPILARLAQAGTSGLSAGDQAPAHDPQHDRVSDRDHDARLYAPADFYQRPEISPRRRHQPRARSSSCSPCPYMHRFGDIAGAMLIIVSEYIAQIAFTAYLGNTSGLHIQLIVIAAAAFVVFGLQRLWLIIPTIGVGLAAASSCLVLVSAREGPDRRRQGVPQCALHPGCHHDVRPHRRLRLLRLPLGRGRQGRDRRAPAQHPARQHRRAPEAQARRRRLPTASPRPRSCLPTSRGSSPWRGVSALVRRSRF